MLERVEVDVRRMGLVVVALVAWSGCESLPRIGITIDVPEGGVLEDAVVLMADDEAFLGHEVIGDLGLGATFYPHVSSPPEGATQWWIVGSYDGAFAYTSPVDLQGEHASDLEPYADGSGAPYDYANELEQWVASPSNGATWWLVTTNGVLTHGAPNTEPATLWIFEPVELTASELGTLSVEMEW